jgi:hypothetical protein
MSNSNGHAALCIFLDLLAGCMYGLGAKYQGIITMYIKIKLQMRKGPRSAWFDMPAFNVRANKLRNKEILLS